VPNDYLALAGPARHPGGKRRIRSEAWLRDRSEHVGVHSMEDASISSGGCWSRRNPSTVREYSWVASRRGVGGRSPRSRRPGQPRKAVPICAPAAPRQSAAPRPRPSPMARPRSPERRSRPPPAAPARASLSMPSSSVSAVRRGMPGPAYRRDPARGLARRVSTPTLCNASPATCGALPSSRSSALNPCSCSSSIPGVFLAPGGTATHVRARRVRLFGGLALVDRVLLALNRWHPCLRASQPSPAWNRAHATRPRCACR
jgi:hypothetical protein